LHPEHKDKILKDFENSYYWHESRYVARSLIGTPLDFTVEILTKFSEVESTADETLQTLVNESRVGVLFEHSNGQTYSYAGLFTSRAMIRRITCQELEFGDPSMPIRRIF
jgi:hypothetical protein